MNSNLLLLRNHKLFRQLTTRECKELNIINGFILAKKNEFIYLNSFQNHRLYFLKKGYVKIGHYDENGNEVITEVLQEGDIFGQVSLEKEENEGEFAQAIKKDASICSFTISDFERILEKRPDLAISFTKLIGLKLKTLRNRVWDIIHKDVKQRLIDFLIYLGSRQNQEGQDKVVIENFLTHADIANLIGSTRQTVTSLMNQLSDQKLIYFDRKIIMLNSLQALRKAASIK